VSAAPSIDPAGQLAPAPPVLGADEARVLFERHAGPIYGYCLKRLGGREEAEDAVQTTFLNAFRALRRGVVPEFEAAWLYTIAENVCRERHRSPRRRLEVVQDPTSIEEAAPAVNGRRDELFGLDEALARMAPRQRRALLLREWKGLSYREIAQELRLSPGAVETLLFRARRSLARNLQVGSFIPWLKSLLGGSAAVKAAAAAGVVVASASLAGGGPVDSQASPATPKRAAEVAATGADPSEPSGTIASRVSSTPVRERPEAARVDRARMRPPDERSGSLPGSPTAPAPAASGGEETGPGQPSAPVTPPTLGSPPASAPPSTLPTTPPPPLPVQIPATPPPPELPALPALPGLPSLPPPPPLPPAPQLPPIPELPALPPPPELPQVPELPKLP
jgi:RNA polymerase sigma factor (sigma-70 family)